MQHVKDFVIDATTEEIEDVIFSLLMGTRAGIAGMEGEDYTGLCKKPKTKKEAISRALGYCKAVMFEMRKVIYEGDKSRYKNKR
jgi:hypothetical protein